MYITCEWCGEWILENWLNRALNCLARENFEVMKTSVHPREKKENCLAGWLLLPDASLLQKLRLVGWRHAAWLEIWIMISFWSCHFHFFYSFPKIFTPKVRKIKIFQFFCVIKKSLKNHCSARLFAQSDVIIARFSWQKFHKIIILDHEIKL